MNDVHVESCRLESRALGDIAEVRLGKTPRKTDYRSNGEYKIIKFRDILESGEIDWTNSDKGFVADTPDSLTGLRELQVGDVLVTASAHMSEHIGKKAALVKSIPTCFKEVFVVGEILQIRPRPGVDPRWVLNYIWSRDGYKAIQKQVHGVHLIASRARQIEVPVADFEVQQHLLGEIEKQFSRLDEAIANLKRVKANLKRYKAAVLKAAVEGRLVPTEAEIARREVRTYETGGQLLQHVLKARRSQWKGKGKYKEPEGIDTTDLPELPEGWAWATVDQLAAAEPNAITDGPFGSNLKTEHYRAAGPRVIRLQNIKDGEFADEYAHITQEHFERLRKHEVRAGDLVIASLGEDPPRACIIPPFVGPAIVKADCIRFTPHPSLTTVYLNAALNCQPTRLRVKDVLHGIGRPRLSLGKIRAITLPIPPGDEQIRIAAEVDCRLSLVRKVEAEVDVNLERTEHSRRSILQRAFVSTSMDKAPDKSNLDAASA